MSMGSDDRLVDNLALVRGCEAALPGKITKLLMGKAHYHRPGLGQIIIE